eukprot:Platyproteum_vivax@DN5468_c0_g1_i4.p1
MLWGCVSIAKWKRNAVVRQLVDCFSRHIAVSWLVDGAGKTKQSVKTLAMTLAAIVSQCSGDMPAPETTGLHKLLVLSVNRVEVQKESIMQVENAETGSNELLESAGLVCSNSDALRLLRDSAFKLQIVYRPMTGIEESKDLCMKLINVLNV